MTPVRPFDAEALACIFGARLGATTASADALSDGAEAVRRYGRMRVRALRHTWEQDGDSAIWSAQSHTLRDHLQTGRGRLEFVSLNRQYLQLSQLVGVA